MDWREDVGEGEIPIPENVVGSRALTLSTLAVWANLWTQSALGTRNVRAGRASLATRLGISTSTGHRALKQLEGTGLIELVEKPTRQERLWRITTPDDWS